MGTRIAVVNTRASNIHSVEKALVKVGASPQVISDPTSLLDSDAAVLPGVGAFDAAMRALADQGLIEAVRQFAESGRPLLCVCLGMQILMNRSEEGVRAGLGIFGGDVKRLPDGMTGPQGETLKIPHMGWNSISFSDSDAGRHPYFDGIEDGAHFYFVHSYHCVPDDTNVVAATADYGVDVCAVVAAGAVVGVQFHPEKSGEIGLGIYENFVAHSGASNRRRVIELAAGRLPNSLGPARSNRPKQNVHGGLKSQDLRQGMQVIPAIDLRGGKYVRLYQGDYGRETVFGDDPAAAATRWVAAGASRLHVVDLDGARDGVRANIEAVDAILAAVSVPVQLGGGIRSAESAIELLRLGVDRVVFGTASIESPGEVRATIDQSGADSVIVGVDAKQGIVATRGWTQATEVRAVDLMADMARIGVRRFMYTDTERDGTLSHPNFGSIAEVLETVPHPVIAAGGIATIDDLAKLADLGAEAAVTGLAIYSAALDLRQAIEEVELGGGWQA